MRCRWDSLCAFFSPSVLRSLHGWLTVFWLVAAFPIMAFWSENIPFLVGISVYSVAAGHWSSWQSARTEVRQETMEQEVSKE